MTNQRLTQSSLRPQRAGNVGSADPAASALTVVAPGHRGASPVSVRRQTFTTGC